MNTQELINETAQNTGWCLQPVARQWDVHEYRRRNGRRTEYIRVTYDARGGITSASWAPNLSGFNGRRAPAVGKKQWVLFKMHDAPRTTHNNPESTL